MNKEFLVWDIPTRLCHWCFVASIFYAWFSVEILEDMQQHFYAGYTALTTLLFRLIWGLVGSRYARIKTLFYSPSEIVSYAKQLPNKNSKSYLGHNPVGALSVLAMLVLIGVQAVTGLFNSDDYYHGPLHGLISDTMAGRLANLHDLNFDLVSVVIGLHITAIIFYKLHKKQALTKAMFTGKKTDSSSHGEQLDESVSNQKVTNSRLFAAAVVLILCIAIVYGLATAFSDTLPSDEYEYLY